MDTMTTPREQQPGADDSAGSTEEDVPATPVQRTDDDEFAPTIVRGRE